MYQYLLHVHQVQTNMKWVVILNFMSNICRMTLNEHSIISLISSSQPHKGLLNQLRPIFVRLYEQNKAGVLEWESEGNADAVKLHS